MKADQLLSVSLLLIMVCSFTQVQTAQAQQTKTIMIAGYKHSPSVPTSGSGIITVSFHKDTLRVKGQFSDLTSQYTGGYIMIGKEGESGNMLFRLKTELNDQKTGGTIKQKENTFTLSEAQKPLLQNGELYINITSADHRKGELRGQIPAIK